MATGSVSVVRHSTRSELRPSFLDRLDFLPFLFCLEVLLNCSTTHVMQDKWSKSAIINSKYADGFVRE